jgi:hypothetical protein
VDAQQPGSARQEAERLVATALAAAQLAARRLSESQSTGTAGARAGGGLGGASGLVASLATAAGHAGGRSGGFATGSAECCVCPICRVIAALRDPSPEFAERLATGAGDFAAGLASFLRSVGEAAGRAGHDRSAGDTGPNDVPGYGGVGGAGGTAPSDSNTAGDVWHAATHAGEGAGEAAHPRPPVAKKAVAKKAVAKKAVAKKAVAKKAVAKKAAPRKAVPRKAPGGRPAGDAGPQGPADAGA